MNVSKQYRNFGLVNLLGASAMYLLAGPAMAQSGFVPIGKPQPPITSGKIQKGFSPSVSQPSTPGGAKVEFGTSDAMMPLGGSAKKPSSFSTSQPLRSNRPSFGGLNYGAPQNGGSTAKGAGSSRPSPAQLKTSAPQSLATQSKPRTIDNVSTGQSLEQSSQDHSSTAQARIDVDTCSVHLIDDIEIPAKESGVLAELNVKAGDAVPANKVIGSIDQTLLQIERERAERKLAVAREMASDTSSVDVSLKKYSLAKHEYEVSDRLARKGSTSNQELRRARYSKEAAAGEVMVAKMQKREAEGQARIEEVNLKQIRQMISNSRIETQFAGQVLEVFKHPGEWVNRGEPIVHFARIERVWVEGTVSADECNIQDVMGQKTIVTLKQAGGETVTFNGTIVSIPLKMEAAGSRFRVKAEVQNRFENGAWLLRPEAQLSMKIDLSSNTAKRNASRFNR